MSLRETHRKPDVIILDSDDDDAAFQEELKQALEASKASSQSKVIEEPLVAAASERGHSSGNSTFLYERAKLERERLERQKRLRPDSARASPMVEDSDDEEPPAKRQNTSSASSVHSATSSNSRRPVQPQTQFFWNGELRQTATKHADPRKDGCPTFRLTEILGQVRIGFLL